MYLFIKTTFKQLHISTVITNIKCLLSKRENTFFWYPCLLYPIRTENSIKRQSCLLVNTQREGSSCLLISLPITAVHTRGEAERREGDANCIRGLMNKNCNDDLFAVPLHESK